MKIDVFYLKSVMHVRPMRFTVLFNRTDSSDENPIDVFYYNGVLVCTTV